MTMLVYEKIDDFIEKLGTLEKTTAVYMTVVHAKREDVISATIRIQFNEGTGLFHTFNYNENIPSVKLLDMGFINKIPDEQSRKKLMENYDAEIDALNQAILDEYEKAKQLFVKMGYEKVINAYSV
jgi:hypothetical protein